MHLLVQKQKFSDDPASEKAKNLRGTSSWLPPITVPPAEHLEAAARVLREGKRVAILVGRGALGARAEVEALAGHLGAPVASALLGRTVLSDESPYSLQGIGHLGSGPSHEVMQECDTLLILGSTMPYLNFYPKPGQARCVQIDRDPRRMGLRYPPEVGLTGDVKETCALLLPLLGQPKDDAFLKKAQGKMKKWNAKLEELESKSQAPLQGEFVVSKLQNFLASDAIISLDCGAHTGFSARHLRLHGAQRVLVSGTLATMAPGVPYAIAAKLAEPARQSVAIVGDGGLAMLMAELSTAVRYRLGIKVIVFNNLTLSMVKTEQEELGNPDYGTENPPIRFDRVAEACGARGFIASNEEELREALQAAFTSEEPALVQVNLDPKQKFPDSTEV